MFPATFVCNEQLSYKIQYVRYNPSNCLPQDISSRNVTLFIIINETDLYAYVYIYVYICKI